MNVETIIHNKDFKTAELKGHNFERCTFRSCVFQGANLCQARLIDCHFIDCDLSNVKLDGARIGSTKFEASKLLGVNFSVVDKLIFDPTFVHSNLSSCNFFALDMRNFIFENCLFISADFSECKLTKSVFRFCDLKHAIFFKTDLQKADLRTAKNYQISPLTNKIAGAMVSLPEAGNILLELGLKIS